VDIEYRGATEGDMDQVRALLATVRGDPERLSHRRCLVACAHGEVIGCVRIKELATGGKELSSLAVAGDWRNRGIGSRLVSSLLSMEPSRPLYLLCFAEREAFYARHGFSVISPDELPAAMRDEYSRVAAALAGAGHKVIAMILVR